MSEREIGDRKREGTEKEGEGGVQEEGGVYLALVETSDCVKVWKKALRPSEDYSVLLVGVWWQLRSSGGGRQTEMKETGARMDVREMSCRGWMARGRGGT